MAEGSAVPKTHYLKKEQGKKSQEKPWAYRPDTVKEQKESKEKWSGGFKSDDPAFGSPDYGTWKATYQPMLEITRKKAEINPKLYAFNSINFNDYIRQRDVSLILFFNSSISAKGDLQQKCSNHFLQASKTTKRSSHAYRVIDCHMNARFCKEELVKQFPTVRLYTLGRCRGEVKDLHSVTDKVFKGLVETVPMLP